MRKYALSLLARREHSQLELEKKLITRGFSAPDIKTMIAKLIAEGLQSDKRFAECYIRKRKLSGYGPLRIMKELQALGIAEDVITNFLLPDDDFWQEQAKNVQRKKFKFLPKKIPERAKQSRFLQYRGFTFEQIKLALARTNDS